MMLIFHKTNNAIVITEVTMSGGSSNISHSNVIPKYHKDKNMNSINKLQNEGDCFVTGASFVGALYDGCFLPREGLKHYIDSK